MNLRESLRKLVFPTAPLAFARRWLVLFATGTLAGILMLTAAAERGDIQGLSGVRWLLMGLSLGSFAAAVLVGKRAAAEETGAGALASPGSTAAGESTEGKAQGTGIMSPLRFADAAGLEDVLSDLKELVSFIRERDKYLALDAKLPKGVLLHGPPGTGKTLLARVLAAEAGATFLYASGSSFVEKYVGVGAQRIRELFARARKQSPAVIFIDEIDSIGKTRGQSESSEWDTSLNQLLTELDGFQANDQVMVICATNRREILDEALLRPGRLDRQIYVGLPDLPARVAILRVHTRIKPLAVDVDITVLARRTAGLSGAHLAAIANEAALAAARTGRCELTMSDFEGAMDRVVAGQTGRPNLLSAQERRLVAYHESGHALVGWILGQGAIEKITLLSRSQALGYVLQADDERSLQSRGDLMGRIAMLLGGRAAEQLVTGDLSTGAADDLRKATAIAEKMVLEFGMGERYPHQVLRQDRLLFSHGAVAEVRKIIGEGWMRAESLVRRERGALEALATALLEKESLGREEVEAILSGVERVA